MLIGYLALDPPKRVLARTQLNRRHYRSKVLTGDNSVAAAVYKKVGIHVDELLLGSDRENLNDEQPKERVRRPSSLQSFPPCKARVVCIKLTAA